MTQDQVYLDYMGDKASVAITPQMLLDEWGKVLDTPPSSVTCELQGDVLVIVAVAGPYRATFAVEQPEDLFMSLEQLRNKHLVPVAELIKPSC